MYRYGLTVQMNADVALAGDLIQDRSHATPGGIADNVDIFRLPEHGFYRSP